MWTKTQLLAAMRRDGWVREPGDGSAYRHKRTGKMITLTNALEIDDDGIVTLREWERWASVEDTPPPF